MTPFVHIIVIDVLMQFEFKPNIFLLVAPPCRKALVGGPVDLPVQLIDVNGINPLLKAVFLNSKACDRCFVLRRLVGLALPKSLGNQGQYDGAKIEPA